MNPDLSAAKIPSELECATWFRVKSKREVNLEIERLKSEGVTSLKLGIECTKFNTKNGLKWYDWLVPTLAKNFNLELCFDNFSSERIKTSYRKHSFSEIVEHFILRHGQYFNLIELWRNPSIRQKEEMFENIFTEDVVFTATWAQYHGKKVGLGGIQTVDFEWITKLISSHFLNTIEYLQLDMESEDEWSRNSKFYEKALQGLFSAKGVNTRIKTSETPTLVLQPSTKNIAC
ncbi:hypothetical protein SAMN04489724_2837 [Algoriphagus locisalis]|uniref:Xylose isomerase-like TIM barrel n=1 Tax=Algoriphagus locisalis TaxID=305507 RepID=A0A1I7BY13_9BACT|nr:hypothetical protein [Algoriphagus locisalis]SFT92064.1 hypothetical protein SAMN04489724_2837 [Algoriphagus locisalis]